MVVVVAFALLSVLAIGPAGAQPQPGTDQAPPPTNPQARAADLIQPAVVWVRVHYDARVITHQSESFDVSLDTGCSGFIVNPNGYIVTAGHCVQNDMEGAQGKAVVQVVDHLVQEGRVPYYARDQLIADVLVGNVEWQVKGLYQGSKPDRKVSVAVGGGKVKFGKLTSNGAKPANVIHEPDKDHGDVALLKVSRKGLPSVLVSPTDNIEVGEELLSIGYPAPEDSDNEETFGLTNRTGQINSEITKESGSQTYYETSAALSEGMSGGPATNLAAQVVGLASFKNEDANYIVPASTIREMLNDKNVENVQGQLDQLYRQGLESLYRGAYSDAIKNFDQVLALMPGHRLAQAKKILAAERRQKFGDPRPTVPPDEPGRSSTVLIGGAAAVLVVLAATAALVLRKRRSRYPRRRRAPAPEPFTGNVGWESTTLPPASQAREPSGAAGQEEPDDADLGRMAPAEPSLREPHPARPGAVHDSTLVDATVRDGARTATSVWDPEATTGSQPDAEPTRRTRNFCSNCGNRVLPDDLSCLRCGASLD
jgi:serine protease Do